MQADIPAEAVRVRIIARDAVSGKMGTADLAASGLPQALTGAARSPGR